MQTVRDSPTTTNAEMLGGIVTMSFDRSMRTSLITNSSGSKLRGTRLQRAKWTKAVASAQAIVESGGKTNKRKGSQSVFDIARNTLQKKLPEDQVPPKGVGFSPDDFGRERVARKGLERLKWELDRYEPFALAVYSGRTLEMKSVLQPQRMPENRMSVGELEETAILSGGDPFSPTTKVKPAVLSVLANLDAQFAAKIPDAIHGRRMALADWIANPRNPLTTRSIVNRIWMWHFGQPIAGNPNNFGSTGKKPTHTVVCQRERYP